MGFRAFGVPAGTLPRVAGRFYLAGRTASCVLQKYTSLFPIAQAVNKEDYMCLLPSVSRFYVLLLPFVTMVAFLHTASEGTRV